MLTSKPAVLIALLMIIITVMVLVMLVSLSVVPLNHDAALYIQCAQLLSQGNTPYIDYVELNPPMVHYLHVVPVIVAKLFGLNLVMTFQFLVVAFIFYSTLTVFLILNASKTIESVADRIFILASWLMFSLYVYVSGSFGQREHLFILGYMPWFFCRVARYRQRDISTALSIIVGVIAAVVTLLKPHFIILAVLVEVWMLYRTRRASALRSPELIAVASVALMYAMHFLFIPSSMRVAFFSRWLPFIVAHYHVYNNSLQKVLFLDTPLRALVPLFFTVIIGITLVLKNRVSTPQRFFLESLIISVVAALGIYVWQQKGWYYQLIPSLGMAAMMITMLGLYITEKWKSSLYVLGMIFLLAWYPLLYRISTRSSSDVNLQQLVTFIRQQTAHSDRVAFISTNVYPAYPSLVNAERLP